MDGGRRCGEPPLPATSSFLALEGGWATTGGGGGGSSRRSSSGSSGSGGAYDHLLAAEDEAELCAESSMMLRGGFEAAAAVDATASPVRGGGEGKGDGGLGCFPTPPREALHNLRAYGVEHFQVCGFGGWLFL